jgi:hypothetical protein
MTKHTKPVKKTKAKSVEKKTDNTAGNHFSKEKIKTYIYLALIALIFIPTYNHIFDKKIALLGDNASYYVLGKAIANGEGYVHSNIIDKPKATQFPPGYPAFMAGVIKVFNDDITTIKKANGFLLFLSLVILFFFFRNISKNIHLSFIITAALIFNMHLLSYSTLMMSEIPFIFISSLALLLLTLTDFEKKPWQDRWFWVMIAAIAASYYVRGQGLAVFAALFVYLIIEKKWLHLITGTIAYALLLLPWQIRNAGMPESAYSQALKLKNYYNPSEGLMEFSDWIHRFLTNLERYMKFEIPSAMFGYEADYKPESGSIMAGVLIAVIVVFGIIKLKKYRWAVGGYIFATFGILFLWPEIWNGVRFVLAIVPLLVFLFYYGIYSAVVYLAEKAGNKNTDFITNTLPYFFAVAAFFYVGKLDVLHKQARKPYDPLFRNYFALAKWTEKNLPDSAVVICRKPHLFYVFSHHYVNGFSQVNDMNGFLKTLDKKQTTHIVVYGDGITQRYFMPVYEKNPEKFPVIQQFRNPDVWLLKYNPDAGYTGEWKENKKEGPGVYVYPDGRKYEGEWKNDKMNGHGTLFDKNGNIIREGEWINGVYQTENQE